MTKFYIVRHGETYANASHTFVGQSESRLTDKGKAQAAECAEKLENIHFDNIYSSTLSRTVDTAAIIAYARGMNVIQSEELCEINGGLWENMQIEILEKLYTYDRRVWDTDFGNALCTRGESVALLQHRISAELRRISFICQNKTVCIVTHGAAIRSMLPVWDGKPLEQAKNYPWPDNCQIFTVAYDLDGRSIRL